MQLYSIVDELNFATFLLNLGLILDSFRYRFLSLMLAFSSEYLEFNLYQQYFRHCCWLYVTLLNPKLVKLKDVEQGFKNEKNDPKIKQIWEIQNSISIQGVQGAIWECAEPIPELKNIQKNQILSNFLKN